ncbi:hypothetical protein CEXT_756001 [Caerostris extrusa]|uniref:Uncharacterized protein n=1 Tax=Caerostris extrusa TaxID=172846 RepID=A0AAV4R3N3_CAEEX|nr:hypothetical protein CEXT_756001 [Caerostris extrusa]
MRFHAALIVSKNSLVTARIKTPPRPLTVRGTGRTEWRERDRGGRFLRAPRPLYLGQREITLHLWALREHAGSHLQQSFPHSLPSSSIDDSVAKDILGEVLN